MQLLRLYGVQFDNQPKTSSELKAWVEADASGTSAVDCSVPRILVLSASILIVGLGSVLLGDLLIVLT